MTPDGRTTWRLRRHVLARQGLLSKHAFGRGQRGALEALAHLGYVQIDSISVIERAHHHVLYARVPGYRPAMLDALLARGEIFEYWSHAAAFLPMRDFRFSLPYKNAIKSGQVHWYKDPDQSMMAEILARIRCDGALRARDLDTPTRRGAQGWWDWKPAKKAIEQLYMQGDLMVSCRDGFQKSYDLTERVLPAGTDTRTPSSEEFAAYLIEQHLRSCGVLNLKSATHLRRDQNLKKAVKAQLEAMLADGELQQLQLSEGRTFLIPSGLLEQPLPRGQRRMQLLSPFDNSVIQRERLQAIFGFQYQIECYVPAAKRQFGYFCLPLLYGDDFIGRIDCKAHRKDGRFEVKALHFCAELTETETVLADLSVALRDFARFHACSKIDLSAEIPEALREPLNTALSAATRN